jgi:hypothetical protein
MMIIPYDATRQVLRINLESLSEGKLDELILMDPETFDMMMDMLIEEERFEDCVLFRDNKQHFVE